MPIKYSYDLLNNFCLENNVKLNNNYEKEKLFGSNEIWVYDRKGNKVESFT